MKKVFKNEFAIVALVTALLVGVAVLGVIASRKAPDIQVMPGFNSGFPKPAPIMMAPTDRVAP